MSDLSKILLFFTRITDIYKTRENFLDTFANIYEDYL